MNPTTTTKLAAKSVFSSTHSAARTLSTFATNFSLQNREKVFTQFQGQGPSVKCFSSNVENPDASLGSNRGRQAVEYLPTYLADARAVETYNSEKSPNGALQLSVAENQMLEDLLVPSYSKFSVGLTHEDQMKENIDSLTSYFPADHIYYQAQHGRVGLRRNMAHFLQKMLKLPPNAKLCEDNLILGAGCNAVLENLAFCLSEIGDAVLVPAPYYAAFEFDLGSRAGLKIIPVETQKYSNSSGSATSSENAVMDSVYYPTVSSLDAAYDVAVEETGRKPRILLISHPNNPLGICYPKEVVEECISWAREKEVHLVSDEIYAGSVYKPSNFQSALTLASNSENATENTLGIGPYIHFVYALSKDFASSGLRVGVAYTENESIVLPLQKLNDLCQISSPTQLLVEKMLSPDTSTDWAMPFLKENQSRIQNRVDQLTNLLDALDVPYLTPDSGLFLWMDLSQFLPEADNNDTSDEEETKGERERILYLEMMQKYGLLFTPGLSMRNLEPGFFRCVFTAASEEEFALALTRFKHFVESKRSEH